MYSTYTGIAMSAREKGVLDLTENHINMGSKPVQGANRRLRTKSLVFLTWVLWVLPILFLLGIMIWFALPGGEGSFWHSPTNELSRTPSLEDKANSQTPAETIEVISTILPLSDIVKNIGGDKVSVKTLIPPGANPHTYEISPTQAVSVAKASLFIRVGAGLDDFVDKIMSSISSKETVVLKVTDEVDLIDGDPHVWLDPVIVKERIVPAITEALCRIAPENATYFRKNQSLYQKKLDALHEEIERLLSNLKGRPLISVHSAWRYFCLRYGLKGIYVEEFPGKEPSPRWISTVVDLAKESGARAIFVEPQFSAKMAETIAQELGVGVYKADPIGKEGVPGFNTYIDLMKSNVEVFRKVLGENQDL